MFLPSNITLALGDSGEFVQELQRRLSSLSLYSADEAHGQYDGTTTRAVSSFQNQQGLRSDGVAGPETLRRLNGVISGTYTESKEAQSTTPDATQQTLYANYTAAEEIENDRFSFQPSAETVTETTLKSQVAATASVHADATNATARTDALMQPQPIPPAQFAETLAYAQLHNETAQPAAARSDVPRPDTLRDEAMMARASQQNLPESAKPRDLTTPAVPETKPAPTQQQTPIASGAPTQTPAELSAQHADALAARTPPDQAPAALPTETKPEAKPPAAIPAPTSPSAESAQMQQASAAQIAQQQQAAAPQTAPEATPEAPSLRQRLSGMVARIAEYMEAKLPPSVMNEVQKIGMHMAQHGVRENPLPQNDNALPSPSATPTRSAAPAPERVS